MPKIYRQNCKTCGEYYESQNATYCSRVCYRADDSWKKELSVKFQGRRHSPDTEFKKGHQIKGGSLKGKLNPAWKGDNVSYAALHAWVKKNYGAPSQCSCCDTTNYHRYEWANISGKYLRERQDWIRLCVPCHRRQAAGHILILNDV